MKDHWIVVLKNKQYIKYTGTPCTLTMYRELAHGWHYKKEAQAEAIKWGGATVERRGLTPIV